MEWLGCMLESLLSLVLTLLKLMLALLDTLRCCVFGTLDTLLGIMLYLLRD